MSLKQKVSVGLKQAMRDKDTRRLSTLRLISAAIKDTEIAKRGESGEDTVEISDAEVLGILSKMIKQRKESARAYEEGGRLELAEQEAAEAEIIAEYMPRALSSDEQEAAIKAAIEELGAESIRDMGKVMGLLKSRFAGQMDFSTVGPMVRDALG